MFTKTSAILKNQFFKSVATIGPRSYKEKMIALQQSSSKAIYCHNRPVYLTASTGITMLVLGSSAEGPFEKFILHGSIKLNPNVYFCLYGISGDSSVLMKVAPLTEVASYPMHPDVQLEPITPQLSLSEIYTYYYQVKKAPYHFPAERHSYCELTLVEQGTLETTVDGQTFELKKHDLILYGSQQEHSQTVSTGDTTTYITILFETSLADPQFFNRVFHLTSTQIAQVESFIRVTQEDSSYKNDELVSRLKLLILSLINTTGPSAKNGSSMKEKYDQDLCQQITEYIKENPSARVIDVTQAFGMSRSNIQNLFHRHLGMQPHAYIEEQRLKQAKILMRDSSYSLTDIARMVGYNSLPAFSRSFKNAFGYSPSTYAKQIYKQV